MIETLKEIWAYRSMIRSLVHKDLRGRYQGPVPGECAGLPVDIYCAAVSAGGLFTDVQHHYEG